MANRPAVSPEPWPEDVLQDYSAISSDEELRCFLLLNGCDPAHAGELDRLFPAEAPKKPPRRSIDWSRFSAISGLIVGVLGILVALAVAFFF